MKKITLLFLNLVFCFTLFAQINIDWQSNSVGAEQMKFMLHWELLTAVL
ncbi:MAG: hypothetical protein IPI65_04605 [Bacteroidetes bacterium]|nr:hypothetical protein [Bacteroidota bacterium]